MAGTNSCATKRSCQIRSTGLLLAKIHNIAAASRAGCVIKCPSMSMTAGQPLTTPTFTFHHCAVFSSRFSLAYLLVKRVFSIFGGMHAVSLAGWPMVFFFNTICPLNLTAYKVASSLSQRYFLYCNSEPSTYGTYGVGGM